MKAVSFSQLFVFTDGITTTRTNTCLPASLISMQYSTFLTIVIAAAWTTWAISMEWYCGKPGSRITSCLHPHAMLLIYIKGSTQLSQLKVHYQCIWGTPLNTSN